MALSFGIKATNAIQLQEIGWVHAIPAGELQPGDETVWNFGCISRVEGVRDASAKFIEADLFTPQGRHRGLRRLKKDRLVGVPPTTYLRHRPADTAAKINFVFRNGEAMPA